MTQNRPRTVASIGAAVIGLHVLGWGALFAVVLPAQSHSGGNTEAVLALAVGAYALGIRHAFDADHIAAIDNATRRFISEGRNSASSGFWFALGHSTVVITSVLLLGLGLDLVTDALSSEDSALRKAAGIWGALVSGLFLLLAGALNLPALRGLHRARRALREGHLDTASLQHHLDSRGVLHRIFRPLARLVDRPTKLYPLGILFGLGLDTAASISLFVLAGAIDPSLPWYTMMVLPILFTAGMTLFDSADGIMMQRVYRWASTDQRRKIDYNLVVTSVSVGVAFVIGSASLLAAAATLTPGSGLTAIAAVDLNFLGVGLIGFFALSLLLGWFWKRAQPASTGLPRSSFAMASTASRSTGTARRANSSSTRETGPETDMAAGVGASGTGMAKHLTPSSCSCSSMA